MEQVYGRDVSERYPGVTVSIERIDPETAKLMLERNTRNRNITSNVKQRSRNVLGRAMSNGEWALNGSTIVFDDAGTLLDGQHRLYSCVQTGYAFDTLVVRGVKSTSQVTMDSGKKRSVSDQLKIDGAKHYALLGAAASAVLTVYAGGYQTFEQESGTVIATRSEIVGFAEKSRMLQELVAAVDNKKKASAISSLVPPGCIAAFVYIASSIDRRRALDFLDALNNPAANENVMVLVNQLTNNKAASVASAHVKAYTKADKRLMLKRCWNAFVNGRSVTSYPRSKAGSRVTEPKGYDQRVFEAFVERDMAGAGYGKE